LFNLPFHYFSKVIVSDLLIGSSHWAQQRDKPDLEPIAFNKSILKTIDLKIKSLAA